MRISRFFIDRPIFAAVLSLVITLIGGIAYFGLGINQLPDITPPTITVSASYPGASAQTVADTVAAPIEQEVNGVEGMIYMASQSTADGSMSLTVTFDVGTDPDKAQVLVQNRVSAAERRLPDEVRRTGLTVRKRSPDLLLAIHLISPDNSYDQVYISNYGLLNVRDKLMRLYGVADVSLYGVREYSMRIWLDPERIALRGLTAEQVLDALRAQNVQVAGGALGEPPVDTNNAFQVALQMKGRLRNADEFENIIVKIGDDGRVVRVKDIGRVELGALSYSAKGYADRYPAVVVIVDQQPGSNAVRATQGIKQAMQEIARSFPKGLEYRLTYNPTEFIEVSVAKLYGSIVEATVLVVLVVLVFLKTWRATIIPVVAIPVSLVGSCVVMQAFGFTLNMLTLFGLVLSVGIVVDDAIVVVENFERRLKEGLTPTEAARVSMDEVGAAIIAIALVLLAVFVPTTFITGITGQFYRQFAVTIAATTAISLLVSLTLSPALCALLIKPHGSGSARFRLLLVPIHAAFHAFDAGFEAMARGYARLVKGLARGWVAVLVVYVALVAFGGWFLYHLPTGFIPSLDRAIVIISLQLPPGSSLARTEVAVERATELVLSVPGVKYSNAFSGRNAATFTAATNAGLMFLVLDDFEERHRLGQTIDKIAREVRSKLAQIEDTQSLVFIPPPVRGMGAAAGFSMRLQDTLGLPPNDLAQITREFVAAANQTPGIANVFTTFQAATPQVFVDVDRDKAQMLKVPVTNIFEAMRVFMGSAYVNDFNMFGRTYRVTAQADGDFRLDADSVAKIRVRNNDGQMVPLGSLVTFKEIAGPERVPRYNLFPSAEVNGTAQPGISSGQTLAIMRALAEEKLPQGVTFEWTDLSYQEAKVGRTGYYIFVLSVIFVFLALAAQYESWSLPLAIMLIVPMCLFSAAFGVWLHGRDINILTQIGFVVLIALAAKNAILIVEFARQIEERGSDPVTAAVEACRLRLRPIIMTSLAFTLGVTPLYLATGAGAEMRIALGTAVFWGMIGVTLFGLIFTPVFYVVIRGFTRRKTPASAGKVTLTVAEAAE
ncbi:MAG TPA: multidrug efflux RND transporter permease subunit [Hyphomicrobiaceae bacterium]|nr:multidrug efflux RND transporter permease subunit [Hyphomicrobiaceae bacterium]